MNPFLENRFLEIGEENSQPKKRSIRPQLIVIAGVIGLVTLGSTLASQITINSGSVKEFGQGVIASSACDSDIRISPLYSFINKEDADKFSFNAIQLSNISSNCAGKDFTIKVYDADNQLVPLTTDSQNPGTSIKIYFQPMPSDLKIAVSDGEANAVATNGYWAEQFILQGTEPFNVFALGNLYPMTADEPLGGEDASDYFALDPVENSVQIVLDPTGESVPGFSDSRNVYRITVESMDHAPK